MLALPRFLLVTWTAEYLQIVKAVASAYQSALDVIHFPVLGERPYSHSATRAFVLPPVPHPLPLARNVVTVKKQVRLIGVERDEAVPVQQQPVREE
jgi:hypothetical protein